MNKYIFFPLSKIIGVSQHTFFSQWCPTTYIFSRPIKFKPF